MIDLHSHSTYSDGLLSAKDLIDRAKSDGISILGISDHDNTEAFVPSYQYARSQGIELIPAVEINTEYSGDAGDTDIHILGYFMDLSSASFSAALAHQRETRNTRILSMVHNLNENGVNISTEDVFEHCRGTLGRPHIAFALIKKGYSTTIREAFDKYLVRGTPGYVKSSAMSVYDAIDTIKNAGGIAVIAHPGHIRGYRDIIPVLVEHGIKGLEVYHPDNTAEERKNLLAMTEQYGLLVTGGSDYHGDNFGPSHKLGCPELTIEHYNALRALAS